MSGKISEQKNARGTAPAKKTMSAQQEPEAPWRLPRVLHHIFVSSIGDSASPSVELQINNEWKVPISWKH